MVEPYSALHPLNYTWLSYDTGTIRINKRLRWSRQQELQELIMRHEQYGECYNFSAGTNGALLFTPVVMHLQ
jgi:hypothetical protein